jgi:CRP-like cAMP-binding protein
MSLNLFNHIERFTPISEDMERAIEKSVDIVEVKNRAFLFEAGQVCRTNYFVEKGCLRMYFINDKGKEQITQFAIENWWISDYWSQNNKAATTFYLQAIEETTVLAIGFEEQAALGNRYPAFEHYIRMVLQHAYAAAQMRIRFQYDMSREALYHHFSSAFPEFVQRVPQYMLASYLGFTPEYLSEIRKTKVVSRS